MSENPKSSNPLSGPAVCPDCGAANALSARQCWLCHRPLGSAAPLASASRISSENAPTQKNAAIAMWTASPYKRDKAGRGPATFSLATLMLLVTLAAVLCGLTAVAPGLGIPLAVLVTPALVRTFAATNVHRAQGTEPTTEAKIGMFLASIGLMVLIMIAGFAVFFVGCCATFSMATASPARGSSIPIIAAIVFTCIAVLVVMIWMIFINWPRKSKTQNPQKPPST